MGTMAVGRIIILSALITQTLSAPSGCIETCNYHQTSYQSRQSSTGHHANLLQGGATLDEHDYTRPGNWTERNQYSTDEGHGKVHEERGQYVEGANKVRYYKKNFTSSYGSNVNGAGTTEFSGQTSNRHDMSQLIPSNQRLESLSAYDQSGAASVTRESGYNRVYDQRTQSSSSRYDSSRSERLEDFGEHGGYSQVNQRVPGGDIRTTSDRTRHHNVETAPGNWSRVDSYRTDSGHGRVFEEEGQYVTGPKKVRYYKKNYTSSYGTSGAPQIDVDATRLQDLHSELQQNLHKQLDSFRREFHQSSSAGHATHTDAAHSLTRETVGFQGEDLQTAETGAYKPVPSQSTDSVHRYTTDQQQRETLVDTRQHVPYVYPSATADTYGTESQRTYQSHDTYVSRMHPASQPTSRPSVAHVQLPTIRDGGYQTSVHDAYYGTHERHVADEIQRAAIVAAHQSSLAQNQLFADNSRHANYHQSSHDARQPDGRRGHTTHYEERWSSSSSSRANGDLTPEHRSATFAHDVGAHDRSHYDRDAYNEQRGRYHSASQGYDSRTHASESSYDSAHRATSGQLMTGTLDRRQMAQGAVDCTEETQQYQQETRYHRKYKRDEHNVQQTAEREDFTQQNQEPGQEAEHLDHPTQQNAGQHEFGQQTVNDQHSEDLTQQTEGQLEFGQQTVGHQHVGDLTQQSEQLTQQTEGQLEFGQQTVDHQHVGDLTQQSEQLTQQTEGQLEFGQQTVGHHHLEDLTQQSEQLTQQTEGQLEFGQQTVGHQHLEDLTQQSEQLTQQTEGQLEFGQQTVGHQHVGDLTQQNERLTQQTEGQLEFGQQTIGHHHLEDLTQQSEQLTQQTEGQLEFGQQTVGHQHLEDLTQQSEQLTQQTEGQLEFGQQTVGHQHVGDLTQQSEQLTQQTEGQLEFGQQTVGHHHLEDLTQQSEQLTQQTEGQLEFGQQTVGHQHVGDLTQQSEQLTQQTEGQLEFGQQTVGHQHLEDLTQQSEQLTQQTEGQLEFGQQTVGHQHVGDLTQQNERLMQQTEGQLEFGQQTVGHHHLEDLTQQSEQLTQQTEGQLEFGQQTVGNKHLEDLTQQTEDQIEFGQHSAGHQRMDDLTQQIQQYEQQQTGKSDDFTQQTVGKLEFGQQAVEKQQRLEHLAQRTTRSDDLTQQQTTGKLEFGQQTVGDHHSEDLTQQSEQLTQQTDDKLDFGQQTVGHQHLEDLTQQNEQLMQQPEGQLEFGQQTIGNKHLEDLTQQTQDQLEFGQQTVDNQHLEGLMQQTEGQLEFGQQTVGNKHLEDLTQQTQDQLEFGQQTVDNKHLEDLTQQTEDQLEFGQQTVGNKHLEDLTQQTEDQLEFGQQTVGNKHLEGLMQQTEGQLEFGQQTTRNKHLEDLTQQTEGKIEFGQQTVGNKHLEGLMQQTEGQLEFGQQTTRNKHLEDLTQQTEGKIEFGQQTVDNQHFDDLMQQSEKVAEQRTDSDEFTQQTVGKLEFDQHARSPSKPAKPKNEHLEEFNEHNEDFTQQTAGMDDFTQQMEGQFEQYTPYRSNNPKIGNQYMEDFTQHNKHLAQQNEDFAQQVGGFDDFARQTTGHLEYGQQRERQRVPSWKEYNDHLESFPQQSDWNTDDISQQSHQYPSFDTDDQQSEKLPRKNHFDHDFSQQTDDQQSMTTGTAKPAAKPKPRQRYPKRDSLPSHMDGTDVHLDDVLKPIEVNPEADIDPPHEKNIHHGHETYSKPDWKTENPQSRENGGFDERDNADRLHKLNDATAGLSWHYTHRPSDLTNVENSHDTYYSRHSVNSMPRETGTEDEQRQSMPFDFDQRETHGERAFDDTYQQSVSQLSRTRHNAYDQRSGPFRRVETPRFDRQPERSSEDASSRVIPLENGRDAQQTSRLDQQAAGQTEPKIESRILEVYGGGPYDPSRDDEIYRRVKPNPSATLPPIGGEDPWDIREKPREMIVPWSVANRLSTTSSAARTTEARTETTIAETTTRAMETTTMKNTTTEEAPPSFWSRLGHKITNTYDKAKEKAKEYFG